MLKMGEGGMIGDDDECWILSRRRFKLSRKTHNSRLLLLL
jgi:hypothetical protein